MTFKHLSLYIFIFYSHFLYFANGYHSSPTTPEIIRRHNFAVESHKITTDDGYILEIFRILPKEQAPQSRVYLLMHDVMGCSDDFVVGDVNSSFAFHFASEGYEVWLANARGNRYSMEHITLSPNDRQFWNFSWHEIGVNDLRNTVDYIINETGAENINYFGIGQGGTVALVLITVHSDYNSKFGGILALGPLLFAGNATSKYINDLAYKSFQNPFYVNMFISRKLIINDIIFEEFDQSDCISTTNYSPICYNFYFLASSYNSTYNYEASDVSNILPHATTTCSTNQLFHFAQNLVTGHFAKYDYNFVIGDSNEPDYDLSNINTTVVVFSSTDDITRSSQGLQLLLEHPKVYYFGKAHCDHFEHIDFYNISKFLQCYQQ